ncbi:MAG TPA: DUF1573 domain-containing protein [Candidatus Didemnitutus sp.]|nr:DUF1573 domain-containing protein [Candidatus Didemnitutus sp.]
MFRHSPLSLLGLLVLLTRPVAALEWKSTTAELRPAPMQSTVEIVFEYTNTGAKPVAIRDVQTNCGCIDAASDRAVCQPGETGKIQARFIVGDRFGVYEREISVVTDDAPAPVHLRVSIDVPEVATVTPRSLDWKRNATTTEQTIEVRAAAPLEIEFNDVTPTNDSFTARLETVEVGRLYRIHVKPASTTLSANAAIRIVGKEKSGRTILVSAYADVQ